MPVLHSALHTVLLSFMRALELIERSLEIVLNTVIA